MDEDFEPAAAWISQQSGVSNDKKLELYALYKIATTSSATPTCSRPGFLDFAGRAKWDAWKAKGELLERDVLLEEADTLYVELVQSLGWSEGSLKEDAKGDKGNVSVSTMLTEDLPQGSSGTFRLHDLAADGLLEDMKDMKPNSSAVNSRDDYGFTPLHLAADRGHASVVKYLIENGADCLLTDADDNTASDLAEVSDRHDIVDMLSKQKQQ